jgi:tRNA A-37 threonylcarbamoyl transferase component Bud32
MSTHQMTKVPFKLHVQSECPEKASHVLTCTKLLRQVPGRRRVYAARLGDEDVIAKIFETKFRAKFQLANEWKNTSKLKAKGLNCPRSYFFGKTGEGQWVLVTEFIKDSNTALELYLKSVSAEGKLEVLSLLFRELAKLNEAGIIQKDLHLGNFLIKNNKVFPLDAATMKFKNHALSKTDSFKQLAILSWYVPEESGGQLGKFLQEYGEVRGWTITSQENETIQVYMKKHIKKEIKRQLKKTLRTSGRNIRIEENGFVGVFDKTLYEDIDVRDFLENIDKIMESGEVMKNRPTSFVTRTMIKNKAVVIKRYNHKNLFHSIRQGMQRSRACRSWLHGHRLSMLGVKTPKPLAYIEKRRGRILMVSYIITENIEGPNLADVFIKPDTSCDKQQIKQNINSTIKKMHDNFITHGDLKRTNFIISGNEPYVTDLDSMKVNMPGILFGHRQKKDVDKFKEIFPRTG